MRQEFLNRRVGYVDPGTAVSAAASIWNSVKNLLNIGDNVPGYPIKSQNTLKKLQGIVQQNVPLPPKSIDDAKQLIVKAEAARAEEIRTGNGGDANKTIIIMYGEVIEGLKRFIETAGQSPVLMPGTQGNGSTVPTTVQTSPGFAPAKDNTMLYLGLGAVALLLLSRKKRRR